MLLLADRPEDTVLHYLGGIEDGGDRRAQIVRDHRREVGLKLVGLFQLSGLMFNLVQRLFVKPPGDDVACAGAKNEESVDARPRPRRVDCRRVIEYLLRP